MRASIRIALLASLLATAMATAQPPAQRSEPREEIAQQLERREAPPPQPADAPPSAGTWAPTANTSLAELVARVAERSGRGFLIHARTPAEIYVGGIAPEEVDYPQLLSILRNNDLLAVEIEGRINIVPASSGRIVATRVVRPDAQDVPDDEVVTMVLRMQTLSAPQTVPILRPLMPQWAHLAAMPEPNTLIVVDQFANARRIAAVLAELDR